ncbi:polysaccharide deacetylase family protein [Siphonobacter aquaeclarae]|uniref:polysaccharide deacetylase family protein n=1 Tax=Siphonobacter aquaeclarae TaxID=563176 RepID=UPI00373FE10A
MGRVLRRNGIKGNFFLTGDFLRKARFRRWTKTMVQAGHYVGSHSDKHLLYCDWTRRDSLLVSRALFDRDLDAAYAELKHIGVKQAPWFLPPYEWYNRETVRWSEERGLTVFNFTPGTGTNADYTWPGLPNYRSSDTLWNRLLRYEAEQSLDGAFLLIHLGTDPRRKDKFYRLLDGTILPELRRRGYTFERLPDEN